MRRPRRFAGGLVLLLASAAPLLAQGQRDPTLPPLLGGAGDGPARPRASQGSWPVIFVDGKPHVAVGGRLHAEGQMVGSARIERITETEVWLREGRALRKIPNYPGVQRGSVPPAQP